MRNSHSKKHPLVLCSLLAALALYGCGSAVEEDAILLEKTANSRSLATSEETNNRPKTKAKSAAEARASAKEAPFIRQEDPLLAQSRKLLTSDQAESERRVRFRAKQREAEPKSSSVNNPVESIQIVYKSRPQWLGGKVYDGKGLMLFKNGTFTDDFESLTNGGLLESMQTKPKRWGTWRIESDGKLDYRYKNDSIWTKTQSSSPSLEIGSFTLEGCYKATSAITMPETSSRFDAYCFHPNGFFTNDKSQSELLAQNISSVNKKTSGEYQIIGPMLSLEYANGPIAKRIVGLYGDNSNSPIEAISVNGKVFFKGS